MHNRRVMEERRRQRAIDDEIEKKYADATVAESEAHRKVAYIYIHTYIPALSECHARRHVCNTCKMACAKKRTVCDLTAA